MPEVTNDLVSFEVAKLAKEKGFEEGTFNFYDESTEELSNFCGFQNYNTSPHSVSAPSYFQLHMWLIERKNFYVHMYSVHHRTSEKKGVAWGADVYDMTMGWHPDENYIKWSWNDEYENLPTSERRLIFSYRDMFNEGLKQALLCIK